VFSPRLLQENLAIFASLLPQIMIQNTLDQLSLLIWNKQKICHTKAKKALQDSASLPPSCLKS
jgi:hypothetical protein